MRAFDFFQAKKCIVAISKLYKPLKIIVHVLLLAPPGEQPKINIAKLSAIPKLKILVIPNDNLKKIY